MDELNYNGRTEEREFSDSNRVNFLIQMLVDGYLRRKEMSSMDELLKTEGIENKDGVIYGYHIEFVQLLIQEELSILGIDLQTVVEKNGSKFVAGQLSDFEKKYFTNKINNLIGVLDIVKEKIRSK